MHVRAMSTERLVGVTARLLAAASLLVVVGLGLVTRSGWRQVGQSYGPDGTPTAGEVPFSARVAIAVFESSFRPAGLQLTVAAVLVAGAVMALQFHPCRPRLGSLRWEVLGAGSVVLVILLVFVGAHAFVISGPEGANGDVSNVIGPQPMTEAALVNLLPLAAALLTLVVTALWWVRLGDATDVTEFDEDSDPEDAAPVNAGPVEVSDAAHEDWGGDFGRPVDHSRDWSPEDFRPPR